MRPGTSGLQAERTGLAWQRSALAAGAVSLLLVYRAAHGGWGLLTASAALTAAAAAALAAVGVWRERALRRSARPAVVPAAVVALVAVLVVTAAATALASLFF